MLSIKSIFITNILLLLILFILNSCGIYRPVSAKEYPPDPDQRVQKNLEEGRGVTIMGALPGGKKRVEHLILQAQMNCGERVWTL